MLVLRWVLTIAVLVCITGDKLLVSGNFPECDSFASKVDDVLDWLPVLEAAFRYGLPEAHQTMTDYTDHLLNKCHENPMCEIPQKVLHFFSKPLNKYRSHLKKCKAREVIKSIAVKLVSKYDLHFILKALVSRLGDIVSANPLSLPADVMQFILEITGYEDKGKFVGVTLNTLGGVYGGFTVGGPPGDVVGGAASLAIWGTQEYSMVNYLGYVERAVKYVVNSK